MKIIEEFKSKEQKEKNHFNHTSAVCSERLTEK